MLKDDTFWGIVIYDILEDGRLLNGIWTNTFNKGEISNEIARKKNCEENGLTGDYTVCWIEPSDCKSHSRELNITENNSLYTLTWGNEFLGEGFKMNNKLVVTYWKTK